MNMLLHVAKKDSKSSCSGLAFHIIKKALFIFRKRKLYSYVHIVSKI
jgi:hypothetical protein